MKNTGFVILICLSVLVFAGSALASQPCILNHTGNVPLTDLGPGSYSGYQGGLYPGGSNVRPGPSNSQGIAIGRGIKPLDVNGQTDSTNGLVGMVSIGMSNTHFEFQQFIMDAQKDPTINPKLRLVNGAQSGEGAEEWTDPTSTSWSGVEQMLRYAHVTGPQVQIVWIKLALLYPSLNPFPSDALTLQNDLRQIVLILKSKYPNTQVAYISSRIYGGYTSNDYRAEPLSYGFAWSTKWLVESYINGDAQLVAGAPWLSWGPYLWADGAGADNAAGGIPGRSDKLEWLCSDFNVEDRFHPSPSGSEKVAQMLLTFFKNDATSASWFLK